MADMTMVFKVEYDVARQAIKKSTGFDKGWQPLISRLATLMGETGFDGAHEAALTDLRAQVTAGPSQTRVTVDKGILQAAGGWTDVNSGSLPLEVRQRAASLKLLNHMYLQNKAGKNRVWVCSLPVDFSDWPSKQIASASNTAGTVKTLLASSREHFSDQQRRYLGNSVQQGMAWCQKASIVLANAASASADRTPARNKVKLWFAEAGLAESTLDTYIATLATGFKVIISALNRGNFIVTDMVPLRASTDPDDIGLLQSEAFTAASSVQGMDVVYIESAFFTDDPGGIVSGQANWTRVIVHELSHLLCDTDDVNKGQDRYAWYGIGPHAGYPGSDCVKNADNWAFFAADCAGVLTDAQRARALKVI